MPSDVAVTAGARVTIDGLKARPELNGSLGVVQTLNEETGRWNVLIDDMREALALKVEALTVSEDFAGIVVGTKVRIASLEKREELNGKIGTVQGFVGERASVYVDAIRESVALKRDALAIAEDAPSKSAPDISDPDAGWRTIRIECQGITLKLTLSAKMAEKPVADALLKPFLKAFSKKKGYKKTVDISEVAQVAVDSDGQTELQILKDIHIFKCADVLGRLEGDIDMEVHLKDEAKHARPEAPAKEEKKPDRLPKDARVLIHGLRSEAGQKLNGLEGRLSGFNEAKDRYDIKLEDGRIVSAKMENLIDLKQHQL